jgi:putative phage-type endonuclease
VTMVATRRPRRIPYTDHADWLAKRRFGVGASEAAAAIGMSRYPNATPRNVWLDKCGHLHAEDISEKLAVELGVACEPVIAKKYERATGRELHRIHDILQHPTIDWMLADPDRSVAGEPRRLVECKTAGIANPYADILADFGPPGSSKVPLEYRIQVLWQMAVTGAEVVDLAVLFGDGRPFTIYEIERDDDDIAELIIDGQAFWDMVVHGVEPDVLTSEDARAKHPRGDYTEVDATPEIVAAVMERREIQRRLADLEQQRDEFDAAIMDFMGSATALLGPGKKKLAQWPYVRELSEERARQEFPDACAAAVVPRLDGAALKSAIGAKEYEKLLVPKTRRFTVIKEQA